MVPSRKRVQVGKVSCSPHEMGGYSCGIASSTWGPVSTESANHIREQISHANCVHTFFAAFKSLAVHIWKTLIATCVPECFPRQMSVNPPEATATSLRFSSPVERIAEAGSRSVALHTFPKAVTDFAVCKLAIGYAYAEMMEGRFKEKMVGHPDPPDRLCL